MEVRLPVTQRAKHAPTYSVAHSSHLELSSIWPQNREVGRLRARPQEHDVHVNTGMRVANFLLDPCQPSRKRSVIAGSEIVVAVEVFEHEQVS